MWRPRNAGSSGCSAGVQSEGRLIVTIFPSLDSATSLQPEPRCRFFLSLFYANLLWFQISYSQRSPGTLGPSIDVPLPYAPVGLTMSGPPRHPRPEIAVISEDPPSLHFYTVSDTGTIVEIGSAGLMHPCREIVSADLDGDGENEIVGLGRDGESVHIYKRHGTSVTETSVPVANRAQRLLIADIDNDGRKDLLVFGKSTAGVAVLRGVRAGLFVQGPVLFQEISASGLAVLDLNGDGIADVLLSNWLSNQLVVFFGISRGVFSEQVTVALEGEPADLAVSEVGRRRLFKIAVALPQQKKITVFDGNAAGEFVLNASIGCPSAPTAVSFAHLNADRIPDLVASTDKGMVSVLATTTKEYSTPVVYGIGTPGRLWNVADLDGDRLPDLVLIDQSQRRLVVAGNSESHSKVLWPEEYAVGNSPHGVCLADVNGDGLADIVVANSGSASLSVLLNRGNGKMSGQWSYTVPEFPALVRTIAGMNPPGGTVVTSHPRADKIAVVRLDQEKTRGGFTVIQAGSQPYILHAAGNPAMGALKILVRHTGARSVSFSLFEQISNRQYLEKSFRTDFPNRIRYLSSGDLRGSGNTDLVFVTVGRSAGQVTVATAPENESFSYKGFRTLFAVADTVNATRFVLCSEGDAVHGPDVILGLGPPLNALAIGSSGVRGDSGWQVTTVEGIRAAGEESVILRDLDGDGRRDLLVLDSEKGEVLVLYGLGSGQFSAPRLVCPAGPVSSMAVSALHAEGVFDLVLTNAEKGTVSVHRAPFRHLQDGSP
jgi:hypothetical protein